MRLVCEARSAFDRNCDRGADARGIELPFDQTPCVSFFEQLAGEGGVQRMPATVRDEMADDWITHQRHVANDIENLVPDELVFEAQRVQRASLAEHNRIFERAAEREAILPQHLDFLQEAE